MHFNLTGEALWTVMYIGLQLVNEAN